MYKKPVSEFYPTLYVFCICSYRYLWLKSICHSNLATKGGSSIILENGKSFMTMNETRRCKLMQNRIKNASIYHTMIVRLYLIVKKKFRERSGRRKCLINMKCQECNPKYEQYFGCHCGLPYNSELRIRALVTIAELILFF